MGVVGCVVWELYALGVVGVGSRGGWELWWFGVVGVWELWELGVVRVGSCGGWEL